MYDTQNAGSVDIHQFNKMFEYINQWLNIFKTYDRNNSGLIDDQELNQGDIRVIPYAHFDFINFLNFTTFYLTCSLFANGIQFFAKLHQAANK